MHGFVFSRTTYPLPIRLVDSVQRILDGDPFKIPRRHLEPQWEVQVDFLDWRLGEVEF